MCPTLHDAQWLKVHLQDLEWCMGCSSLLLLTMLSERIKLLPQRIHIAYARVSCHGVEPGSYWKLHACTMPLQCVPHAVDHAAGAHAA